MAHRNAQSILSATTLIGDPVKNYDGDDLGKIEELMIDLQSGRIAYAVLSIGGFLGIGDKLFAIPWELLTVNQEEKCFELDIDEETLENAPGFDKDNWPETNDYDIVTRAYAFYERDYPFNY